MPADGLAAGLGQEFAVGVARLEVLLHGVLLLVVGLAHARDCLTASRALAGVLASLSASELSHPVALT